MTTLTYIKHQSYSKIGTMAGIIASVLLENKYLSPSLLGVMGTIVGAHISMPTQQNTLAVQQETKQINILKHHFNTDLNPMETNYNLYERDQIGDCLSLINSLKNSILSNFITIEESVSYRNKMISEKYIILDTFHDADIDSIILDVAPLCAVLYLNKDNQINSILDTAILYVTKPFINYILYTQDSLNDYERVELDFNKYEISTFEDCLPPELAVELIRVAV
jgi:hypothetical protein